MVFTVTAILNSLELLTAVDPLRTASCAYSTCSKWPSGENTVIALSYLEPMLTVRFTLCNY